MIARPVFIIWLFFSISFPWLSLADGETKLKQVKLEVCAHQKRNQCLTIASQTAESTLNHNAFFFRSPELRGLGFEKKTFSSAIIDFSNNLIVLRERKAGELVGEWSVSIETLSPQFFPLQNSIAAQKGLSIEN
jgi:hypothetical protein